MYITVYPTHCLLAYFLFSLQLLCPASQQMHPLYCFQSLTCVFSNWTPVSVSVMHMVAIQTSWQLRLLDEAAGSYFTIRCDLVLTCLLRSSVIL